MYWWNRNKSVFGLLSAVIFWAVSLLCFVYGLAFENPTGYKVLGIEISILIAFGLGIANTFVQIVGNDQNPSKMGMVLFLGWVASYMFGIGSNVNTLYQVLGISNSFVKFLVCGGLGTMIEVLPEWLIVNYLKSVTVGASVSVSNKLHRPKETRHERERRHAGLRTNRIEPDKMSGQNIPGSRIITGSPPILDFSPSSQMFITPSDKLLQTLNKYKK